jgi:hypothetical protein
MDHRLSHEGFDGNPMEKHEKTIEKTESAM